MKSSKSLVVSIIAIVAICGSIYIIFRYGTGKKEGGTPERTTYICNECEHEFQVDTEDVGKLIKENPARDGMIKCPECGKYQAEVAIRCIHCREFYLERKSREEFGERGRCTKCGKSARTKIDGE